MTASIDGRRRRGCRYWRNLALFAWATGCIGALFLMYVGHPYYLSRGWSHPKRSAVCCVTPADYGLDYEDVSFNTSDGLTLRGWYVPSTNGAAVILLHPIASNRVGVLKVAEVLARHGYGVLLFDLRAHGESDGELLPFGGNEAEDVRGAAAYLQTRTDVDPNRIGAMGLSLGAQVSILGAARTEAIRAVAADAPCCTTFGDIPPPASPGDWLWVPYDLVFFPLLQWHTGVSDPEPVREAIARISPRPILLIGGESEWNMQEHLYRAAAEPKSLWLIPGAGHIDGLSKRPEEYEARIVGFFDRALLGETQ
jgi:pimeloyl-ACP methyl ester carboxylesterase